MATLEEAIEQFNGVDIASVSKVYSSLMNDAKGTLNEELEARRIKQEDYAKSLTVIITTAMQLAISNTQQKPIIDKQIEQLEAQILLTNAQKAEVEAATTRNDAQSTAQVALLGEQAAMVAQQILTETQRTAQVEQAVAEATDKQAFNVANVEKQGLLLDEQIAKLTQDALLVTAQKDSVLQQVKDNRIIKALDIMGETYSGAMTGGLKVTTEMWTTFYSLVALLIDELKDYKGAWDATTAFPTITPVEGDFYNISVAGTINVDGTASWAVGDIVYFDGNKWKKSATKLPSSTTVVKA